MSLLIINQLTGLQVTLHFESVQEMKLLHHLTPPSMFLASASTEECATHIQQAHAKVYKALTDTYSSTKAKRLLYIIGNRLYRLVIGY